MDIGLGRLDVRFLWTTQSPTPFEKTQAHSVLLRTPRRPEYMTLSDILIQHYIPI